MNLPLIGGNQLLAQITPLLAAQFGIHTLEAVALPLGHLNEKWKLETNKGTWFVKSYNKERYRRHEPHIWDEISRALQLQGLLHESGGTCPALLAHEGRYLHETPEGERFVVMRHSGGRVLSTGTFNAEQMYSLGAASAHMHQVWNDLHQLPHDEEPHWRITCGELESAWEQRWQQHCAAQRQTDRLGYALQLQKAIIDSIDYSAFSATAPGWTHLDLWSDNLLFDDKGLAAIVDFDRVRYAFPLMDLGRAILSCGLHKGELREELIYALAEGYRSRRGLVQGALLQAVRHIWCVESFWWFNTAMMNTNEAAPRRFVQEMIWTAELWDSLEQRLGSI
jgi:homoserine kinase type II